MQKPKTPQGYNTINPFIITQDALKLIAFLEKVFDAKEEPSGSATAVLLPENESLNPMPKLFNSSPRLASKTGCLLH